MPVTLRCGTATRIWAGSEQPDGRILSAKPIRPSGYEDHVVAEVAWDPAGMLLVLDVSKDGETTRVTVQGSTGEIVNQETNP